eukprot:1737971-Rhodomonas_salina.1
MAVMCSAIGYGTDDSSMQRQLIMLVRSPAVGILAAVPGYAYPVPGHRSRGVSLGRFVEIFIINIITISMIIFCPPGTRVPE